MVSPLRYFNLDSVRRLIDKGVGMFYDHSLRKDDPHGEYFRGLNLIGINRRLKKKEEDHTILHEWLHAYEEIILEDSSSEESIDWWAEFHLNNNPGLVEYIRREGVLHPDEAENIFKEDCF